MRVLNVGTLTEAAPETKRPIKTLAAIFNEENEAAGRPKTFTATRPAEKKSRRDANGNIDLAALFDDDNLEAGVSIASLLNS